MCSTLTPKFPPEPPRQAQKTSGFTFAPHVRVGSTDATTTVVERRLSLAMPYIRALYPKPPPRSSPLTPTPGQMPPGNMTSYEGSFEKRSRFRAPPPRVTVERSGETDTVLRFRMSMSRPVVVEYPAKLCPPDRMATYTPF